MSLSRVERIGIIGLGYTGLHLAIAMSACFDTVGYDICADRVKELQIGYDRNLQVAESTLRRSCVFVTNKPEDLKGCSVFIITVPTPIDANRRPNLDMLAQASETVGRIMQKECIVIYESTVYPGATEEFCCPILSKTSKMEVDVDFGLAYSPERINPGDMEHTFERIVKVVSAHDRATLDRVECLYESIVSAGVYRAASIRVAEAAKLLENIQRDVNIALANEMSVFLDGEGISSKEVFDAAATKWNFARFSPGLVGGPCIGVVPYYFLARANERGLAPEMVATARRTNDNMVGHVIQRVLSFLENSNIERLDLAVCGVTFKRDVPDVRNSLAIRLVDGLRLLGHNVCIHDPLICSDNLLSVIDMHNTNWEELSRLDGILLTVPHKFYRDVGLESFVDKLVPGGLLADLNALFHRDDIPSSIQYWSL